VNGNFDARPGVMDARPRLLNPRIRYLRDIRPDRIAARLPQLHSFRPARPMPRPIGVKQIDHVTFVVADLEQSRTFYGDVLGMQPAPRPPFNFVGLWFAAGNTYVHLILEHDQSGPAGASIPENVSISRTRHVAFEVASARQTIDLLAEHGVPIVSGPKNRPDGPIQLYVLDPDRNLIELFSMENTI